MPDLCPSCAGYLRSAIVGRLKEFAEDVSERCKSYAAKWPLRGDELKKASTGRAA